MENRYPIGYTKALAQLIREGDVQGFTNLRYPYIQETEPFVFEDEDFRGTDITKFPATFNFCYRRCDFRGAILGAGEGTMWTNAQKGEGDTVTGVGLTFVAFVECDMQGINLSYARASACRFYKCNLSGALWSDHTRLGWSDSTLSCLFDEVVLDADLRQFLDKQGAKFARLDSNEVISSYDVSENCIFAPDDAADFKELRVKFPG